VVLLGPNRELARLALAAGAAAPLPPEAVFDWDLAAAAHAAEVAAGRRWAAAPVQARSGGGRRAGRASAGGAGAAAAGSSSSSSSDDEQGPGPPAAAVAVPDSAAALARPRDFKGFVARIGQDFQKAGGTVAAGLQKAFDETQRGLQKVAQVQAGRADWVGSEREVSDPAAIEKLLLGAITSPEP
jgi:hypothetical protein